MDRPLLWLCLKSPELVLLMTFRPQERLGHMALMVFPSCLLLLALGPWTPLASATVVTLTGPSSRHPKEGGPIAGTALGFQKAFPKSAYPAESPKYSSQGMESRGLPKLSTPEAWGGKWSRKRWKKSVKGQPCQLAHAPRALRGWEGAPSAVQLECGWGAGRGWWQKASGGSGEAVRA